jgi:hypothetical protein
VVALAGPAAASAPVPDLEVAVAGPEAWQPFAASTLAAGWIVEGWAAAGSVVEVWAAVDSLVVDSLVVGAARMAVRAARSAV